MAKYNKLSYIRTLPNKWWSKGSDALYYDIDLIKYQNATIKLYRKELEPLLKPGFITIIKGPRRAGKTLAIKLAIKKLLLAGEVNQDDILYFSFDEATSSKDMDSFIRNFLNKPHSGQTYIFLDEIQTVKSWAGIILGLSNSGLLKNTSVVVTGSIAHFFSSETLPGRGTEGNIYYLRTASFKTLVISLLKNPIIADLVGRRIGYTFLENEIKSMIDTIIMNSIDLESEINDIYKKVSTIEKYFLPLSKLFDLYINSGGYPRSIQEFFIPKSPSFDQSNSLYEEIYNYIKNDAATITSKESGDSRKAGQAVSGVLGYIGKKVSYSKIAQKMSMNKTTLIDYSNRLENSFVFLNINGMKSFEKGLRESEVKKFYFSDVFMHYSAGAATTGKPGEVYSKELINSLNIGTIVEEIIADHLIRVKESDPMRLYRTYLRFYDGNKEIDFIYKKNNGRMLGIEVKYQNTASFQDIKMVNGINDCILLTKSSESAIKNNCAMIPTCLFLTLLQSSEHNL